MSMLSTTQKPNRWFPNSFRTDTDIPGVGGRRFNARLERIENSLMCRKRGWRLIGYGGILRLVWISAGLSFESTMENQE